MRQFVVEQTGYVQVEATRRFVVEVPDDIDGDEVYERMIKAEPEPEDEDMAWRDDTDHLWIGYDVDVWETDVCEAEADDPSLAEMKTIKLEE